MYALRDAQDHFAATLADGPLACPDDLFAGAPERVLRGLKVHANTISHARLIALEETFPRTRALQGDALFNQLCRAFLDGGNGLAEPLARVGYSLPDWFENRQVDPAQVAVARFEWCWLESYHAAEAMPLRIEAFAGMDEADILEMTVIRHPAAHIMTAAHGLAAQLGIAADAPWLLIARPAEDVLIHPVGGDIRAFLDIFGKKHTLGAAIETFCAARPNDDAMGSVLRLIETGALTREDSLC